MDYLLRIKKKSNSIYNVLDIFPDTVINFGLDFYDVDNIDKIKVPVSINIDLPMNQNNTNVIEYDPSSSSNNVIPNDPFDFILSLNGSDVLSGDMFIEGYSYNNEVPVISTRVVDKLQEIFKNSNNLTLAEMYNDYDTTQLFDALLGINEGVVNTDPSPDAIVFPYIDFANDINKFNYAARQFMQFGYDKDRVGIVPTFSVREFIDRFFSELNIGVTSKFFQLGTFGSEVSGVDPEYMYMALPIRIRASSRTKVRGFILVEGPYNYYINDYTKDLTTAQTNVREKDFWPDSTGSWNYNNTGSVTKSTLDFGVNSRYNLPNDFANLTRAYFGSSTSYTGRPLGTTRQLPANSFIGVDMPMLRINETNYLAVKDIDKTNSDAQFVVKSILWIDGYPTVSFRMCNSDGSVKVLNIADADVVISSGVNGSYGMEASTQYGFVSIHPNPSFCTLNSQLQFDTSAIGDFAWEQKEYEIVSGSVYSVSIEIELLSGSIRFEKVDTWVTIHGGLATPDTTSFTTVGKESIGKMIYREDLNNIGNLYLGIQGLSGTYNPYYGAEDDVNIYESIRDNDTEIKPSEVIREIMKRFNLSAVYDQNTNSVLLDRLTDIRQPNPTVDIQNKIDDAEGIEVELVYKTAKSLSISGLDSLHFDKYGYDTVILNTGGSDELKFELKSRFFNESLCGSFIDVIVPEGFNQYEIGLTTNDFTPVTDIGITFAYLAAPQYKTNIKRGRFVDRDGFKGVIYDTYDSHVFAGRLLKDRTGSIKLYHFDETDATTDLYDFFTGNDNIIFYNKPTIRFTALFSEDYIYNIKTNYSVVTLPQVYSSDILIKSVNGQLYEGGIYANIEGIIL